MNIIIHFIIYFLVCFKICESDKLIPSEVKTEIGLSYTLFLETTQAVNINKCFAKNKNDTMYELDPTKIDVLARLINNGINHENVANEGQDIMKSLGNNICGFKMENISETSSSKWSIILMDSIGKNHTAEAKIIKLSSEVKNEERMGKIGTMISIPCVDKNMHLNYCQVFNPKGQLVLSGKDTCFYSSDISNIDDFGVWKCYLGFDTSMIQKIINITYKMIEEETVENWKTETETHVNIGCKVKNPKYIADYCLAIRPDGEKITLAPGFATSRYTCLNTDIKQSICSLQIAKPLQDSEWGQWRCEHRHKTYKPIGGFIIITNNSTELKLEPIIPKSIFVHMNKSLSIICQVPYSSPYCYMRSPDGMLYPVSDDRSTTLGICQFTKNYAELSDNGTWFCGFAKSTGESDDVYKVEVHIPEVVAIRSEKQMVMAEIKSIIYLMCTTKGIGDRPLQYCRFLSPDGHMYHVGNKQNSSSYSYAGRGLEYGDCGIKIMNVQKTDFGTWSCITRIGYNFEQDEVYTNINLGKIDSKENITVATSIGIFIGVILILSGFGFIMYRRRKQRLDRSESILFHRNDNLRTSNDSITNLNTNEPNSNSVP